MWVALDCGHAINPLAVEGQIEGSVWMGMGQALCEETRYLEGLPAHASLLEYRMPTIAESPPIEVQIVESHDPYGPFGAKEASEGALAGFPPALVNAIANAIGIDLDELPVTPDRVMEALIQRRRQARLAGTIEGRIMSALAEFHLAQPSTVKEAVAACAKLPGSRFVAGGTDLIVNMRRGISRPDVLIDLSGIDELSEIKTDSGGTTIGAGVTIAALARDASIAAKYPALAQAAAAIAGPGHRVLATVGGNLCLDTRCIYYNQSEWWRSANHLLSEKSRRYLSCRPARPALSRRLQRRSGAGAAGLWRRSRYRRPARRAPNSAKRSLCRRRQGASDACRRRIHRGGASAGRGRRPRLMKSCGCAAPSIFPWRASPWRSPNPGQNIGSLRIALTGTNSRPFLLAGTDAFAGRPLDDKLLQEIDRLVQKQVQPMRTTLASANYRRARRCRAGAAPRHKAYDGGITAVASSSILAGWSSRSATKIMLIAGK